jgi:ABC-2 type transport system permease protein
VDPSKSWRSASAGRFQALLLLIYPIVSIPIALAYLARYAFDSVMAFYLVLAFAAALGGVVYWIAMESAVSAAAERREKLVAALSQGEGPVAG